MLASVGFEIAWADRVVGRIANGLATFARRIDWRSIACEGSIGVESDKGDVVDIQLGCGGGAGSSNVVDGSTFETLS